MLHNLCRRILPSLARYGTFHSAHAWNGMVSRSAGTESASSVLPQRMACICSIVKIFTSTAVMSYDLSMTTPEAQALVKRPPDVLCNSRKKGGDGHCKRPAGWGTNHAGVGRCKLHGGSSPKYMQTPLMKEFLNPETVASAPSGIRDRASTFLEDPVLTDLSREIANLRAMAESVKLQVDREGESRDFAAMKSYFMIVNTIGKLVKAQEEVLRARRYVIPIAKVQRWADGIKSILQQYLGTQPDLLSAVAAAISRLSHDDEDYP